MDIDTFWKVIEQARKSAEDVYEVAANVEDILTALTAEEIVSFSQHQCDLLAEAHRKDLWAVAYIVNGGCSDDGFMDFRGWLMANGRKRWEAALKTPQIVGKWVEPDEAECQDILYVADHAYQAKAGKPFPDHLITVRTPSEPVGNDWSEESLDDLYPELSKKFS